MQAKTPQIVFLEDYLLPTPTPTPPPPPPPPQPTSAQSILQSWSHLRDPTILSSSPSVLLSSLQTLSSLSKSSLHISSPQLNLLLSLLSSPLPPPTLPPLLRLLYAYLRKSPRPTPPPLPLLLPHLPSVPPHLSLLLLGAISAVPTLPEPDRQSCLSRLSDLLLLSPPGLLLDPDAPAHELLAGIGYALSRSDDPHFSAIFSFLLRGQAVLTTVPNGLMLLRLLDWLVAGFINRRSFARVEYISREVSKDGYAPFALATVAMGALRAFRMASGFPGDARMRNSLEEAVGSAAEYAVLHCGGGGSVSEREVIVQCVSLGLVRCGLVSSNGNVILCLCSGLLDHVFPLKSLLRAAVENPNGESTVKQHLDSLLFKEAGAVTGIFCNQYATADEGHKSAVESRVWNYSRDLYSDLRKAVLVINLRRNHELVRDLEKIAEAAFLMVVVFAAEVTKQKLNPKSSGGIRPEVSVDILVAFSCVEYLRRVRLPEYTDAVRRAVLAIQENAAACALFVESMPPYVELTNQQVSLAMEGVKYVWSEDEVQTARVLFCMRIIPTCISLVPASMFGKLVAPTMFLYMQHPNEKVARASHSVFTAFMSSGKDTDQDDRSALKEKLVFYYIQRALEAYPGVTPFEGLASGVAALVRHLPAGSPATFYCVHSLVEKATELCKEAMSEDANMWKTWEGSLEPCKKVLDLLLRLMTLVDIQVFPYLLKQLAEFVVQLPKEGQNVLLDDMYSHVADSDDVTRKPVLVSWLQSLSYLCSQNYKRSFARRGTSLGGSTSLPITESTNIARL